MMMDDDPDWLGKALLANCPVPVTTREWPAITESERGLWFRYAVTVMRAQVERQREDLQRDLAEARRPQALCAVRGPTAADLTRTVSVAASEPHHHAGAATRVWLTFRPLPRRLATP